MADELKVWLNADNAIIVEGGTVVICSECPCGECAGVLLRISGEVHSLLDNDLRDGIMADNALPKASIVQTMSVVTKTPLSQANSFFIPIAPACGHSPSVGRSLQVTTHQATDGTWYELRAEVETLYALLSGNRDFAIGLRAGFVSRGQGGRIEDMKMLVTAADYSSFNSRHGTSLSYASPYSPQPLGTGVWNTELQHWDPEWEYYKTSLKQISGSNYTSGTVALYTEKESPSVRDKLFYWDSDDELPKCGSMVQESDNYVERTGDGYDRSSRIWAPGKWVQSAISGIPHSRYTAGDVTDAQGKRWYAWLQADDAWYLKGGTQLYYVDDYGEEATQGTVAQMTNWLDASQCTMSAEAKDWCDTTPVPVTEEFE